MRFYVLFIEGDDCISIVGGSENIQATDITCGPGHGIRSLSNLFSTKLLMFQLKQLYQHEAWILCCWFFFYNLIITYLHYIILFAALEA
jgi:hypothetical protein